MLSDTWLADAIAELDADHAATRARLAGARKQIVDWLAVEYDEQPPTERDLYELAQQLGDESGIPEPAGLTFRTLAECLNHEGETMAKDEPQRPPLTDQDLFNSLIKSVKDADPNAKTSEELLDEDD